MAEKRFVTCIKCGCSIDKELEPGWEYDSKSRRYICSQCALEKEMRNLDKSRISTGIQSNARKSKTEKKSKPGTVMFVIGIILVISGILSLFSELVGAIICLIIGIVLIYFGRKKSRKTSSVEEFKQ